MIDEAVFVGVDLSAVTHYRTMLPARALGASMFVRGESLQRGKLVGNENARIKVYSMPRAEEMFDECMQVLADPKSRLVIDLDDCLRAVVEDGNHPAAPLWEPLLPKHEWLIGKADHVTVTTEFLADYAHSCGARAVSIIPNAIDLERWNIRREPRHAKFMIVGWSGANGHEGALQSIAPAIEDILTRRDDIAFASVGRPLSPFVREDLRHRFHDAPFVPIDQHPHVLTQFHINIGPAIPTDFYRSKSTLRALEAMASDSVFIGSDITYSEPIRHGENGLLYADPAELPSLIESVVDDPTRGYRMRKQALRDVRDRHSIEAVAPLWREMLEGL